MSYKKISLILLPALLLLSSCSLTGKSTSADLNILYQAHIKSEIASIRKIAEKLGYMGTYQTQGSISALVDVPTILSGAFRTSYDGVIEGYGISQDSRVIFGAPKFQYETFLASGSLEAKEVALISRGSDMFLKFDGLDGVEILDDAMKNVLSKYNGSWLALTDKNLIDSLSGPSEEEIFGYQIGQAISRMKLDDLEKYLIQYPIWKSEKTLESTDGLSHFEVTLSVENIIAMLDDFAKNSTGKGLSDTIKETLKSSLNEKNIKGTLVFDPKDEKMAKLNITIIAPDIGTTEILFDEHKEGWTFRSTSSGAQIEIALLEKKDGYSLVGNISESGNEVAKIDTQIIFDGKRFVALDSKLTSNEQGLTVTLHHGMDKNGNFEGDINAGVGSISWTGTISSEKKLSEFHLKGAMIGGNVSLDLTPSSDGLLKGPFILKSGDAIAIQANVGLRVDAEHLDLTLDVPTPGNPEVASRGEIHIQGKKQKWNGKIEVPEKTTPFSELTDALSKLAPTDTWIEEAPTSDESSSGGFSETNIPGVIQK